MAGHRYWRILVKSTSASIVSIGELQMRESIGGSNVATGGTASASSQYSASYPASKAFDGLTTDTGTGNGWASASFSSGVAAFPWLAYDFGESVTRDIAEIVIYVPAAGGGIALAELPTTFDWQYSDDGGIWVTQRSIALDLTTSPWAFSSSRIIDVRPLGSVSINNKTAMGKIKAVKSYPPGRPGDAISYDPATPAGKIKIEPFTYFGNVAHGGLYRIAGSTTSLGVPSSRRVRLYHQQDGRLQAEVITGPSGEFEFRNIEIGPWCVVGVDDSGAQNGVIFTNINAVPM